MNYHTFALAVGPTPTDKQFLTGAHVNDYILFTKIVTLLYVHLTNDAITFVKNNSNLMNIIMYGLRFHRGPNSGIPSKWRVHSVLNAAYGVSEKSKFLCDINPNNSMRICQLIGAASFITDVIISAVTMATDVHELVPSVQEKNVHAIGRELRSMFSSIQHQSKYANIQSTINHLGMYTPLLRSIPALIFFSTLTHFISTS